MQCLRRDGVYASRRKQHILNPLSSSSQQHHVVRTFVAVTKFHQHWPLKSRGPWFEKW